MAGRSSTTVHCPVHKKEKLRRLLYHQKVSVGHKQSKNIYPDWWYCPKCDKPFKFKFEISNLEGDKI